MHEKIKKINLTRERDVEKYFCDEMRKRGALVEKFYGGLGAPDRIFILPKGLVFWVEFKRPNEQPTPNQEAYHTRLKALGHHCYVVSSIFSAERLLEVLFASPTALLICENGV